MCYSDKENAGSYTGESARALHDALPISVWIEGTVETIRETERNKEAVVRMGSMQIIVTEKRTGYHYERNFTDLGLSPRTADIIVVKLGYLTEELYDMRGDWMMALTRGGVDHDLLKLPFNRIEHNIL